MKAILKSRASWLMILCLLVSVLMANRSDTDDPQVDKIVKQTEKFREKCQQQKVYLQTDKDIYQTGETVWLKAYIMDAATLQADTVSKEIVVELVDQSKTVAYNVKLRNKKGMSDGYILLNDTLLEGNYQLRAYTAWMQNFDQDYFFAKTIQIKNPGYTDIVTKSRLKQITDFNAIVRKKEKKAKVTFFPESGDMVVGVPSRVAFKAENELGVPQSIKGKVMDDKGNEITTFETIHDGMGLFGILPKSDREYKVKVTFPGGETGEYSLPKALQQGITMSVDGNDENFKVIIKPSQSFPAGAIIIVGQSRGQIFHISKGEINGTPVLSTIPKKKFPAGIAQITLFNGQGEPLCERLIFVKATPEKNISKVDLSSQPENDSISYHVKITPSNGSLSSGNLSLSVVENLPNIASENILTNLLLTSDIKGHVTNPSYYFDANNPDASKHLDLVMLTNGWRRFTWKELLADKFPPITYFREGGISISGKVVGDNISQTFANSQVVLTMPDKYNFKLKTRTDSRGNFEFPALDYDEKVYVKIETIKETDGRAGNILLDQTPLSAKGSYLIPILYQESYDNDKLKENTKRDDLGRKKLSKVKIDSDEETPAAYGNPSATVKVGADASSYSDIFQYLHNKVAGVVMSGNKITIRGEKSYMGSNEPLFILDGMTVDQTSLSSVTILDFDRIEVFKGVEASAFGSRGANGAIVFYTKRSSILKHSSIELYIAGYQKAREFYIPPYQSRTYKTESLGIPKTICWKPNIILDQKGEAVIRLQKDSRKTTMLIEGLTNSGEIIYKRVQE